MGWASRGRRRRVVPVAALPLLILLVFLLSASLGACSSVSKRSGDGGAVAKQAYYSSWEGRRRLVGPGSSPPTCRSRCGGCHPCRPVHVAIQPGRSFPLEYYPEAWRCKCGDKLFMPGRLVMATTTTTRADMRRSRSPLH